MNTSADYTVAFELVEGIILLPGSVNGTEGHFAFDTGAMRTVLNSARCGTGAAAKKNALTFDGGTQQSRLTTLERAKLTCAGVTQELHGQPAMDMTYVEAPLRKTKPDLCFLGSIGADLIGDERFLVDYPARELTFRSTRMPEGAVVRLLSRDPLPVVPVIIDGRSLPFVLDTGANHFVIDRAAAPMDILRPAPDGSGAYLLPSFSFAGSEYRGATGLVSDLSAMRDSLRASGIIGSQVLSQRVCCFDYPNGRICLK